MKNDQQTDPTRYSLGWVARIPLMAYRKYRTRRAVGTITYAQCGEDVLAQGNIGSDRDYEADLHGCRCQ